MSKDVVKLLNEFKDELKQELKMFRESLERDIRTELRDIRADLKELTEIKKGMSFINQEHESMKQALALIKKENSGLKKENAELNGKCGELARALKETENRLVSCEQYSRNNNLEVKGIPKDDAENVDQLISKLGEVIGEPITKADVEACHRVPTRDREKSNIIVRFQNRNKRDCVLEKAKKKRISCSDLGLSMEAPVYVNEHLCPYLKKLLGMTTSKKREHRWLYVWVRNGKIFAKKASDTPVITISKEDDLSQIC